ncbi:M50 family metallopeptidase [Parvularcula dongshanensis]|uniref:Regulator of sigma E protease n=1 Tax=Parvularcula dongshanensis TaxID=1173995 RepID=A0A840I0N7_9PROT|nr:M50 family metallopeptidase [Parvularcula dongshanensis]MBB4658626.1 regulator of sigma E protease [Parvularcula dongshanensis]
MASLFSAGSGVLIALLAFAVLLPLIVFVHEYGHFKVARLCGVKVDAFSIGFGPALKSWRDRHGTVWKISAIPLGGYVKFFGDANAASAGRAEGSAYAVGSDLAPAEAEPAAGPGATQFGSERAKLEAVLTDEQKRVCFHFKPVWQRMAVVAAGPFANFVLAAVVFAGLFMAFGKMVVEPVIGEVTEGSAAEVAGFQTGDRVVRIDGRGIDDFNEMATRVRLSSNTEMVFDIERDGRPITLFATPERVVQTDAFGNEIRAGRLGMYSAGQASRLRMNPVQAVWEGTLQVGRTLDTTIAYLGRIVVGREDARQLGGPIKIAQFAGQAASSGFTAEADLTVVQRLTASLHAFLSVAALISVSIGFLNLLPVPVLDGGHLVFYGVELLTGRPLPDSVQGAGFRIGLAMVGTLMVFVVVNDIMGLLAR